MLDHFVYFHLTVLHTFVSSFSGVFRVFKGWGHIDLQYNKEFVRRRAHAFEEYNIIFL